MIDDADKVDDLYCSQGAGSEARNATRHEKEVTVDEYMIWTALEDSVSCCWKVGKFLFGCRGEHGG